MRKLLLLLSLILSTASFAVVDFIHPTGVTGSCDLLCTLNRIIAQGAQDLSSPSSKITSKPFSYKTNRVPPQVNEYNPRNILGTVAKGPSFGINCLNKTRPTKIHRTPAYTTSDRDQLKATPVFFGKRNKRLSPKAKTMIDRLRQNVTLKCTGQSQQTCKQRKSDRSIEKCWRYVKLGLMAGGYTEEYISSLNAYDAHSKGLLRKVGFVNQIGKYETADNAPAGAILVYKKVSHSRGTPGHIEVKASDNEYISDHTSQKPIDHPSKLGAARKLVGIYVETTGA